MKKLLGLLLALALLCGLTACADRQTDSVTDKLAGKLPTAQQTGTPGEQPPQTEPGGAGEPDKEQDKEKSEKPADGKDHTRPGQTDPAPAGEETFSAALCGRYRGPEEPDGSCSTLEITDVCGLLLLERGWYDARTQSSYYTFSCTEFRPDRVEFLQGPVQEVLTGRTLTSSGFALAGGYWDPEKGCELHRTDDGLELVPEMSSAIPFTRHETARPLHDDMEELSAYFGRRGGRPAGQWTAQTGAWAVYMDLEEDGAALTLVQRQDQPAELVRGFWRAGDDGKMTILGERAGWGGMPVEYQLSWSLADGALTVENQDGMNSFTPEAGELTLLPMEEGWLLPDLSALRNYDNSLIGEISADDGTYVDGDGNSYEYSFHIPMLIAHTPDADRINSAITAFAGDMLREQYSNMEKKYGLSCYEITWNAYWHGSMVSLVLEMRMDFNDVRDYAVYNYDFSMGREVANREILEQLGCTEEEYLELLRTSAVQWFDGLYGELPAQYKNAFYDRQRAWTGSDENVSMDRMMYLDENGALAVVMPVASLAGADWYYYILYPFAYG